MLIKQRLRRARRCGVGSAIVLAALACALPAGAGTPGKWDVLARGGLNGVAPIAAVRTPDGTLHVVWPRATGPATSDLLHATITPSGKVGTPNPIGTGWPAMNGVALALRGNELLAFFSGTQHETQELGLHLVTSSDGGRTWSAPTTVAKSDLVYSRVPSVAVSGSNVLEAWYAVGEPVVHPGLDPSAGTQQLSPPGTSVNLVSDGDGKAYVAWCSATTGQYGVWVAPVDPGSGAPSGAATRMPGSTVKQNGADYLICPLVDFRMGLAARQGGGIYTGVFTRGGVKATDSRVVVWRVGGKVIMNVVRSSSGRQNVTLAPDGDGHVWVAWTEGPKLFASRSNRAGTAFGRVVSAPAPSGQADSSMLGLSAQRDRLDALVTYDNGGDSATRIGIFHTQLDPGLTLTQAVTGRTVTFTVTDAGDAVAGATVSVAGKQLRTNASGKASTTLPPGRYAASASKASFVAAAARVQVKKR